MNAAATAGAGRRFWPAVALAMTLAGFAGAGCGSTGKQELSRERTLLVRTLTDPAQRSEFTVRLARENDVDFYLPDTGRTLLIEAVLANDRAALAALLARGADPELADRRNGDTALFYAAPDRDIQLTALLLQAGAKPDTAGHSGKTALMEAARFNQLDKMRLLLQAGANPNARDRRGRTPLLFAAMALPETTLTGDAGAGTAQLLLEAGADEHAHDDEGRTALVWAVESGNPRLAGFFLERLTPLSGNADRTAEALLALRTAIRRDDRHTAEALLAAGVPLNRDLGTMFKLLDKSSLKGLYTFLARNGALADGKLPLFWAAEADNVPMIDLLLKGGADPTCLDNTGHQAIDYAHRRATVARLKKAMR